MPDSDEQRCPDCGGSLEDIKMFARTPIALTWDADGAVVRYAKKEARRGWFWSWMYESAGRIKALKCSGCHRIFLYGEPKAGSDERANPFQ
jgi:hypothetical protein